MHARPACERMNGNWFYELGSAVRQIWKKHTWKLCGLQSTTMIIMLKILV